MHDTKRFLLLASPRIKVDPIAFGDIYNKSTWVDATDFSTIGDASVTLNGSNFLDLTTSTIGQLNHLVVLDEPVTGLGKYKFSIDIKLISVVDATNYGFAIGLRSSADQTQYHNLVSLNCASGAQNGRLTFYYNGTILKQSPTSSFTVAQNDILRFSIELDNGAYTVQIDNLTNVDDETLTYTFASNLVVPFLSNTGNLAINQLGGDYEVRNVTLSTNSYRHAKLIVIGDSKCQGLGATNFTTSFVPQLEAEYVGVSNNSGGSDVSNDVQTKIPEIISLEPRKVLLNIGSNDRRRGDTTLQWSTRYDDIVTQLEAAGIEVYHLLILEEVVLDFTAYNAHITSTYPAGRIVDAGTISLAADDVHPDQTGHDEIYDAIVAQIGGDIT